MTKPPSASPAATPPAPRRFAMLRVPRLRSTPARIRALALVAVLALVGMFVVASLAVQDARDGLRVVGHTTGPQVVTISGLYYALSDMDARLADALLAGDDGAARENALTLYERRRGQADWAAVQGARVATSETARRSVRDVLYQLGKYERLAEQALDARARHPAGPPSAEVTDLYRQATDLMKLKVLPKAYNLTLTNGAKVRQTYEDKRSAVLSGRIWVILTGVVLIAVLVGLQIFLAKRFRRLVNPFLAVATVGTIVLVAATVGLLSTEAGQLRAAKEDGFDSVVALSRIRAISADANADESRYLLLPDRADAYQQAYLAKSQSIVYVPANGLAAYHAGLKGRLSGDEPIMGLMGSAMHDIDVPGQREVRAEMLTGFQRVQQDDRYIRQLTEQGKRRQAIASLTTPATCDSAARRRPGGAACDFRRYDRALVALTELHQDAFEGAVQNGDEALDGWKVLLPGAAVVILILILAGVRPRLSEYR